MRSRIDGSITLCCLSKMHCTSNRCSAYQMTSILRLVCMHACSGHVEKRAPPFTFGQKSTFQAWARMDKMSKNMPVIDFPPQSHFSRGIPVSSLTNSVILHCLNFYLAHKFILHPCARNITTTLMSFAGRLTANRFPPSSV